MPKGEQLCMKELDKEISQCLTYQEGCKAPINLYWSWCCEQWMVHMISNIQCEQPVVGTVLDKVENGHCSVREPVHKEGFQKSLSIVQCPAACCNAETSTCYKEHTYMWTTVRTLERAASRQQDVQMKTLQSTNKWTRTDKYHSTV